MSGLTEVDHNAVVAWRERIHADARANYFFSMAIAIMHVEGSERALPWVESARSFPAYQAASAYILRQILQDLGRSDDASRLHDESMRKDSKYETAALIDLVPIYMNTSVIPKNIKFDLLKKATSKSKQDGNHALSCLFGAYTADYLLHIGDNAGSMKVIQTLKDAPDDFPHELREEFLSIFEKSFYYAIQNNDATLSTSIFEAYSKAAAPENISPMFLESATGNLLVGDVFAANRNILEMAFISIVEKTKVESDNFTDALSMMAYRAFDINSPAIGFAAAEKAIRGNSELEDLRIRHGHEYFINGNIEKGIAIMREGLAIAPTSVKLLANLAIHDLAVGQVDAAMKESVTASAIDQNHLSSLIAASLTACAHGRATEAVRLLEKQVSTTPISPALISCFVTALLTLGRTKESLLWLGKLPSAQATTLPYYQMIQGCAWLQEGHEDEAIACFANAVKYVSLKELRFQAQARPTILPTILAGFLKIGVLLQPEDSKS